MKFFRWISDRLKHKLQHVSWKSIKKTLRENGWALVVIIVGWEIVEDILFPILFIWLGKNLHPIFLAGVPASWLLCLHWLAVPLLWGAWIRVAGKEKHESK